MSREFDIEFFARKTKEVIWEFDESIGRILGGHSQRNTCTNHGGESCKCLESAIAFTAALRISAGVTSRVRKDLDLANSDIERLVDRFVELSIDSASDRIDKMASAVEKKPENNFHIN